MRYTHLLPTAALAASLALVGGRASAVELLISGNFETPGGLVGDLPGWSLQEFIVNSSETINTADRGGNADAGTLFLRAFEGGGQLRPRQANFDDDGLPAGDVDGADFLTWQRNFGRTMDALPSEGDAGGSPDGMPDGKVDVRDYDIWKDRFGDTPRKVSARLSQIVPGSAGETYTFQGSSSFETYYSGLPAPGGGPITLGDASPFGQVPSPTQTKFRMEFLNLANVVIGSTELDLREEWVGETPGPIFLPHSPLTAVAPPNTVNVRVVAEAIDMVANGTSTSNGADQSAFFDNFSLTKASDPVTDLLVNGNLDANPADALDFWNQVEGPTDFTPFNEILRTPTAAFSNNTPGGSRGVWLSAFFGRTTNWSTDEGVDGSISQTVQAIAGATYTFSGYTKFQQNYSGGVDTIAATGVSNLPPNSPSPTATTIKLEFLDVNSVVIGSAVIDVKAARRLASGTNNANDDVWRQHVLQAVSPAGTRFARLTASMEDGVFNTDPQQSAFFDDFSLDGPLVMALAGGAGVPEPATAMGLALGLLALRSLRNRK